MIDSEKYIEEKFKELSVGANYEDAYTEQEHSGFATKTSGKLEVLGPVHPLSVPIYASSTFVLASAEHGAALCNLEDSIYEPTENSIIKGGPKPNRSPYLYTRWGNPTTEAAARAIAKLENGGDAIISSSGMAAISTTLFALLKAGDHIIIPKSCYGGTVELGSKTFPKYGIEVTFVDSSKLEEYEKAIKPNTKVMYGETPANPTMSLVDLKGLAELAKANGRNIVTVIDSTFASPYHQQPLNFGIDIVVHSATKYLGGHSDIVSGAIIFSKDEKSKHLRDECWEMLKLFGGVPSPFDAFLLIRGIKTLSVRVAQQSKSALILAKFLEGHPAVEKVHYPGLESHPQHELAKRQMTRGFGGMITFDVKGGKAAGQAFVENLKLITMAVSLGGTESLAQHPASMTHAPITVEQRAAAGITEGQIRFSVGLEDTRDLMADLHQALTSIKH